MAGAAREVALVGGVVRQLGAAEGLAEARPLLVGAHADCDPPVLAAAAVDALRGAELVAVADGRPVAAVHRRVHQGAADLVRHVLRLRHLDELALAGAVALVDAHERGVGGGDAARRVHVVRAVVRHRAVVLVAPQQQIAGGRLALRPEADVLVVRPGQPVERHGDVDDRRVELAHRFVVEAVPRHHPHRVVLDEHVADLHQLLDGAVALLRADLGDDGAPVAAQAVEQRVAVPRVARGVLVHVTAGHVA